VAHWLLFAGFFVTFYAKFCIDIDDTVVTISHLHQLQGQGLICWLASIRCLDRCIDMKRDIIPSLYLSGAIIANA